MRHLPHSVLSLSAALVLMGCSGPSDGVADTDSDTQDTVVVDTDDTDTVDTNDTDAVDTDTGDSDRVDTAFEDTDDSDTVAYDTGWLDSAQPVWDSASADSDPSWWDTDPDTAYDTALDTVTDTDGCTVADLVFEAETRDAGGVPTSTFASGDALWVAGVISNLCGTDVTFTTSSSCLVTEINRYDAGGNVIGSTSPICLQVLTSWTVPTGGSIADAYPDGTVSSGDSVVGVHFDVASATATTPITVTP